ncbi:MAG TPA: radical SAM protein [Clostridia bacterium]|nr:radical SAM protein [Clostridia bacterium]
MQEKIIVHYPQDEMTTFLLPITQGCSYNKCKFCTMYKDQRYKEVSLSEIELILKSGHLYTEKVFLVGADPLSLGFEKTLHILGLIKKHLHYCACVASYASIRNIARYSEKELTILHNAGLRLLYIGFETGRDDILKKMNKPHSLTEALREAKKLNRAHLPFNTIVLSGIAGSAQGIKNAEATAQMINKFTTNKVITMKLMVFHGSLLAEEVKKGDFIPAAKEELLLELEHLLTHLQVKKPMIFDTTHPSNIIKIKGTLPQDKRRLINKIRQAKDK